MKPSVELIGLAILAFSFAGQTAHGDNGKERHTLGRPAGAEAAHSSALETPRDSLSVAKLIGTAVRGANGRSIGEVRDLIVSRYGNILYVVAEVGGTLGIGEQRIGVPWPEVRIDREMRWVQTPLTEGDDGKVSTLGFVSRGENVAIPGLTWNAGELIGDYVSLREPVRYALVADVLFSRDGDMQSVVVRRVGSPVGPGWDYAYPYAGYKPARYADPLPFENENVPLFDYVQRDELSPFSGNPENLVGIELRK